MTPNKRRPTGAVPVLGQGAATPDAPNPDKALATARKIEAMADEAVTRFRSTLIVMGLKPDMRAIVLEALGRRALDVAGGER